MAIATSLLPAVGTDFLVLRTMTCDQSAQPRFALVALDRSRVNQLLRLLTAVQAARDIDDRVCSLEVTDASALWVSVDPSTVSAEWHQAFQACETEGAAWVPAYTVPANLMVFQVAECRVSVRADSLCWRGLNASGLSYFMSAPASSGVLRSYLASSPRRQAA